MNTVAAVVPDRKSTQPDPALLQAQLLRYADDFFVRTTMGFDEYARRANTPRARSEALTWKLALKLASNFKSAQFSTYSANCPTVIPAGNSV